MLHLIDSKTFTNHCGKPPATPYCLNDGCPTNSSSAPPSTCSYYCRLFIELPITTNLTVLWLQSWVSPSHMKPVGRKNGWKESHEKIPLSQPGKSWFQLTPIHPGPHYSCIQGPPQARKFIRFPPILESHPCCVPLCIWSGEKVWLKCFCLDLHWLTYTCIWMHTHNS